MNETLAPEDDFADVAREADDRKNNVRRGGDGAWSFRPLRPLGEQLPGLRFCAAVRANGKAGLEQVAGHA